MTEADKCACAERELQMRQRVYPRWVQIGKMSAEKARYEIECMRAIVEDYRKIAYGESLF